MSSGAKKNQFEVLFKLFASIASMVIERKRRAEDVVRLLQIIVTRSDFAYVLERWNNAFVATEPDGGWASEWAKFYQEVFRIEVDFRDLEIPEMQPGFGWVVMVAEGLTINRVWQKCRDFFPTKSPDFSEDDLDSLFTNNERSAEAAYAVRIRNRVENDAGLKSVSANELRERGIKSITLLERLLLELWYFWRTGGGHLDLEHPTMCAGSRVSEKLVCGTSWYNRRFNVSTHPTDRSFEHFVARQVV